MDRSGPGGAARRVAETELQDKATRPYFAATIGLAEGEIYVSSIDLNREHGEIETPHHPVLRVATPLRTSAGRRFGIFIINLDLLPILDRLRSAAVPTGGAVYLVNEQGDYLLHPDPGREFGFDLGRRFRLQDDLPELATALTSKGTVARAVRDASGHPLGAAVATLRPAGGPPGRHRRGRASRGAAGRRVGGQAVEPGRRTRRGGGSGRPGGGLGTLADRPVGRDHRGGRGAGPRRAAAGADRGPRRGRRPRPRFRPDERGGPRQDRGARERGGGAAGRREERRAARHPRAGVERRRRLLLRRHPHRRSRRHRHRLEPGGRAPLWLLRRRGDRPQRRPGRPRRPPRGGARHPRSRSPAASGSTITRRCGWPRTAGGSTCP